MDANKIKELRERTNSGFLDCKHALEATNDDLEKAVLWLQEKGIAKADKKATRIAAEGIAKAYVDKNIAILFELNSETDFVADNKLFSEFANKLQSFLVNLKFKTLDDVLKAKLENLTIEEHCKNLTAKVGEKISLRRVAKYEAKAGECVAAYTHANMKIATIALAKGSNSEELRNLAMHITALNPKYLCECEIEPEIKKEIDAKVSASPAIKNKPEKIQEQIKAGLLRKEYNEIGVLGYQPYVKDDAITVNKFLENAKLELLEATRFEVGEGIEKKTVDFASEVAEQMKQ